MLYRVTYRDSSVELLEADDLAEARERAGELYGEPIRSVQALEDSAFDASDADSDASDEENDEDEDEENPGDEDDEDEEDEDEPE